jgi:hypothetical protein
VFPVKKDDKPFGAALLLFGRYAGEFVGMGFAGHEQLVAGKKDVIDIFRIVSARVGGISALGQS